MTWAANGRWLDASVIAVLLATGLSLQIGMLSKPSDGDGKGAVAVLFSPWTDAASAMQRTSEAGARIVRFGAFPFIVVVEPDAPDFAARVVEQGAILLLDPRSLAACLTGGRA
jgi:hypothetical protein